MILIGGLLIWLLSNKQREKEIEDEVTTPVEETETDETNPNFEARNDRRTEDMETLVTILENYQQENGSFPSVSQVEDVLLSSGEIDEIPLDPKHGESDRDGQSFGYIYAVYDTEDDEENGAYILSALFEDSQGLGTEWTKGADIQTYSDYSDLSESNVRLLGQIQEDDEEADEDDGPKVKVKR